MKVATDLGAWPQSVAVANLYGSASETSDCALDDGSNPPNPTCGGEVAPVNAPIPNSAWLKNE
jgi:hypothetical protein